MIGPQGANPLLAHTWGVSRAVDRVWAQVTGLPPSIAGRRLLMAFQAFIDDSYSYDGGIYALAGVIASAEAWAAFSQEWEELLVFARLDSSLKRNFKMTEMHNSSHLLAFYRAIEKHALLTLSFNFRIQDLKSAKRRIDSPGLNINWGSFDRNFTFAFVAMMGMFQENREKIDRLIGVEDKIDFIFDNQSEKNDVISGWDQYIKDRPPELQSRFGTTPRFEDDKEFLPLQAADFIAWYVRRCAEQGWEAGERALFGWQDWADFRPLPHISMKMDEAQITGFLAEGVQRQTPNPYVVILRS